MGEASIYARPPADKLKTVLEFSLPYHYNHLSLMITDRNIYAWTGKTFNHMNTISHQFSMSQFDRSTKTTFWNIIFF